MANNQEMDMMKDGARRVAEFLANQGISVKHSLMLEALSAGFGSRNWRTVQGKLNAPSAPPAVTLQDLDGKRWEVHAIYEDNDQPYASWYEGETPMEAAVAAQIERIMDEDGSDIIIVSVIDRLTHQGANYCGSLPDAQIYAFTKALADLGHEARRRFDARPESGLSKEQKALRKEMCAAVEVLEELDEKVPVLHRFFSHDFINDINKFTVEDNGGYCEEDCEFSWQSAEGTINMTATRAVELALSLVLENGIDGFTDEMKLAIYEAKALLKHGARELNIALSE